MRVDKSIGFFTRTVAIDLQFHLIAVGIGVVHRHGDAVMNAPVGRDCLRFESRIILEQIVQRGIGARHVVETD